MKKERHIEIKNERKKGRQVNSERNRERNKWLSKEMKKIGFYEATINLHADIQAKIHIEVVKEEDKT